MPDRRMKQSDYARLLRFRSELRRFLQWSEAQAKAEGVTPGQHQLLLAIKGHDDPRGPTIGEAADYLALRHHSAVGLVNRAEGSGLIERRRDPIDHRMIHLHLTALGERLIRRLSAAHLEELRRIRSFR
ncbi:MAG TPA: MarR family transcriptional regulator [Solirubrobacterales bacterium]|nr:MarR family transcriptional regulator [Solirubrobacterales bacterium]